MVEFPLYIKPSNECKGKEGKILKKKPKYKANSIQPSKTSPALTTITEIGERL